MGIEQQENLELQLARSSQWAREAGSEDVLL
jgi:hypothetical protein